MNKILVVGSSNTDLIARLERFPVAGETIEGNSFLQAMGGKGANQALAAHKLGGDVRFITCLGNDANGENTLKYYHKQGLNADSSFIVDDSPSGTAMIWVDDNGENCIVILAGANKKLSPDHLFKRKEEIVSSDIVLMQMEIPYETVRTLCELASGAGKTVILNAAPACKLEADILSRVDILVVNETEAEFISGEKIDKIGEEEIISRLLRLGAKAVVLTLGRRGCIMKDKDHHYSISSFDVNAVDTTGAGDTFCGALAAQLGRGNNWEKSLNFASAASAICVTRLGAQPSIPTEDEVNDFLKERHKSKKIFVG
jgi:ribokinase